MRAGFLCNSLRYCDPSRMYFPLNCMCVTNSRSRQAALGWFNVGESTPGARPAISVNYVGVDAALQRIRDTVETDGPFDGM